MTRDRLLKPADAAAMLGLTPRALEHRRIKGEFRFVRVGKLVRYRESVLLAWMDRHEAVALNATAHRFRRRES